MAKITKNEIIEDGIFTKAVQDAEAMVKVLNTLEGEIKALLKTSQTKIKIFDTNDVKVLEPFLKQVNEAKNLIGQLNTVQKQKLKLDQEINALRNDDKYKAEQVAIAKLREEKKQLVAQLKLEAQANNVVSNSIEALRLENRQLAQERNRLDTTTQQGKQRLQELNDAIQRNTDLIKENVTATEQQKMNVGNYEGAVSKIFPFLDMYNEKLDQLKDVLTLIGSERLNNVFRKIGFDIGDAGTQATGTVDNLNNITNAVQGVGQQANTSQRPTIGFLQTINTEGQQAEASLNGVQEEIQQVGQEAVQEGNRVEQSLNSITEEARQTARSVNGIEQEFQELGAEARQEGERVERSLEGIRQEANQTEEAVQGIGSGNPMQGLTDGIGQAQETIQGVTQALGQAGQGGAQAGGLLGSGANLAKLGWLAVVVALGAVVKGIIDIVDASRKAEFEVASFTGLSGQALSDSTSKVQALANTFGADAKELTNAANTLSKEFGITFVEALDKVKQGYLAGTDANGEYLDSIKEYSTQIKQAGFTADEFNGILNATLQAGIYSDKGVDAIKEFGLRIREQTKATSEAIQGAFGKQFSDKILGGINKGTLSVKDALFEVTKAMDTMTLTTTQRQTLIADVFGSAGEDAGQYIQQLYKLKGGIDNATASQTEYAKKLQETAKVEEEFSKAKQELADEFDGMGFSISNLWTQIKTLFIDGLVSATQQVRDFIAVFKDFDLKQLNEEILDFSLGLMGLGDALETTREKARAGQKEVSEFRSELNKLNKVDLQRLNNGFLELYKNGKQFTDLEVAKWKEARNALENYVDATGGTGANAVDTEAQRKKQEDANKKAQEQAKKVADEQKKNREQALKDAEAYNNLLEKLRREEQDANARLIENNRQREIKQEQIASDRLMKEKRREYARIRDKALVSSLLEELQQEHINKLNEINQKYDKLEETRIKTLNDIIVQLQTDQAEYRLKQEETFYKTLLEDVEYKANADIQATLQKRLAIFEQYFEARKKLVDFEFQQDLLEAEEKVNKQFETLYGENWDAQVTDAQRKEALDLEIEIAKEKHNDRLLELDREKNKGIEEENKTAEQKHIERAKQETEDYLEKKKIADKLELDAQKQLYSNLNAIADAFAEREQARLQRKLDLIDKEIQASKDRQSQLTELAKNGIEDAADNLAFEQRKQAELEIKREKAIQRQKFVELGLNALKTYTSKLENKDKNALGSTIKDISLLTAFIRTLPTFYTGIENTGKGGNLDDKGGFLSVLHPEERVLTANQNKKIGGLDNETVASVMQMYRFNLLKPVQAPTNSNTVHIDGKTLEQAIIKGFSKLEVPKQDISYDKLLGIVTQVQEVRNKVTITKKRFR